MNRIFVFVILGFIFGLHPAFADGGGGSSEPPEPMPAEITQLIDTEQYDKAEKELKQFVKKEKKNADAWNWLGYSQRSNGDLKGSLKSYKTALRLDRKHLGANEYLGELYIMLGEMKKAKKQLKKLAKYCGDCEQHQKLAEVIKNAEAG
ncbi:MAG: tetratricopeptide repeat protein [Gammaproteobacteria bacterium]|jgi:tetratricopeptide (TPR) repeat protein